MKFPDADRPWWVTPVETLRSVPADVPAVVGYVLVVDLVALTGTLPAAARATLGLPLVFFVPGYALLSVLFPGRPSDASGFGADRDDRRFVPAPDGPPGLHERAVLSLGASLAVLPVVAIGLSAAGAGLDAPAVLGGLSLVAVGGVLVGAVRRRRLPERARFRLPLGAWADRVHALGGLTPLRAALAVLLAVSVAFAGTVLAYGVLAGSPGERYTSMSLLTEDDEGRLVAGDYPTEFVVGESQGMVLAVRNERRTSTTYTAVVALQRVRADDGRLRVVDQRILDRFSRRLGPGERWVHRHSLSPRTTGENLRLVYLLYRGAPPETPTVENAHRHTYLWVNVSAADSRTGGS